MSEDLIRRSDVLNLATCITKPTYDSPYCESVVYVEDIEAIPSVDVEPVRHGRWENEVEKYPEMYGYIPLSQVVCSVCDRAQEKKTSYCSNCGAKMDKGVKT